MAFEEAFNPGMARAREELERERILPAPPPVAGPPPFDLPDLGVDFDVNWSLDTDTDKAPWDVASRDDNSGNDNGGPAVADPPPSET